MGGNGWTLRATAAVALLAGIPCSFAAPPATVPAAVEACLQVRGARVLAGELAAQDARFARLPAETDLGYTPMPGSTRELAVPLIATTEQSTAGNGDAPRVCVMRAEAPLIRERLQAALDLSALGQVAAEVLAWAEGAYPEGKLRMPAKGIVPPAKGTQEVMWRGSIELEEGRSVAVWARVRLEREVPCARWKQGGRRGAPADASLLEQIPCDAAAIAMGVLPELPAAAEGLPLLLQRDAPAGAWLTADQLTMQPAIQRGDRASLLVLSGGVALALPVEAEQTGAVGEQIWVRSVLAAGGVRAPARRRIRATVVGPGKLRLEAGSTREEAAPRAAGSGM